MKRGRVSAFWFDFGYFGLMTSTGQAGHVPQTPLVRLEVQLLSCRCSSGAFVSCTTSWLVVSTILVISSMLLTIHIVRFGLAADDERA